MTEEQTHVASAGCTALVVVGLIDGRLGSSDKAAVSVSVETFPSRVVVASPRGDVAALRYALAAGATPMVGLEHEADVVVFGRGGTQPMGDLLPATIAVRRNAQLVLEVLEIYQREKQLEVIRDLGQGHREVLLVNTPVVLVMASAAIPKAYVSRLRQLRFPASLFSSLNTTTTVDHEPCCHPWGVLRPRTKTGNLSAKTSGSAMGRMFDAFGISEVGQAGTSSSDLIVDEPEVCATQLIRYLAHHRFIDAGNEVGQQAAAQSESFDQKKPEPPQAMTPASTQRSLTLPAAIHRGPRPLSGHRDNVNRRPRPYRKLASEQA